jgi:two-component system, NarL family, response regulator LiaR
MTESPVRVLLVDDHAIVREGLHTLLAEEPAIAIVGMAATGAEALALAAALRPDVVLMDLLLPDLDGIAVTARLRESVAMCRVLVLTSYVDDQHVRDAIQAGALGYLLKDVLKPELVRAIRAAARGEPVLHPEAQRRLMQQLAAPAPPDPLATLTERERAVLCLLGAGRSNKEIAATLHLTTGTVKGYVSIILGKLDVADRTQAALYAVRHGLVPAG